MKVVHHDKLKACHSRTILDNDWVFQEAEMWAPVEAPTLLLDPSSSETDISTLDLWGTSPETEDPVVGSLPGLFSPPPSSAAAPSHSPLPYHPTEPSLDEAGDQHKARGQAAHPLLNSTPRRQPQRVRRAPDMFGD